MANMNPYEIRLELLKMSKDLLQSEYQSQYQSAMTKYHSEFEIESRTGSNKFPTFPDLPKAITEDDIIRKAIALDDFVSRKI